MKKLFLVVMLCSAFLLIGNTASAVPLLQLDISNGVYDTTTETIVATSDNFTLYALLTPNGGPAPSLDNYFISIAILPQTSSVSDFGSFTFDGGPPIDSSSFTFGTPTGLPSHGIFDTAYTEVGFNFNPANIVGTYNTQDNPGGFPSPTSGTGSYFAAFAVDTLGLDPGVILHFDLYNAGADKFAPFSHDAQSVPEPATILLLGSGLVGLAGFGRKKFKK